MIVLRGNAVWRWRGEGPNIKDRQTVINCIRMRLERGIGLASDARTTLTARWGISMALMRQNWRGWRKSAGNRHDTTVYWRSNSVRVRCLLIHEIRRWHRLFSVREFSSELFHVVRRQNIWVWEAAAQNISCYIDVTAAVFD
jgi:hypothetical protein